MQDDLHLGPVHVCHQSFGEIHAEHGDVFTRGGFDGIFGLSFMALSPTR